MSGEWAMVAPECTQRIWTRRAKTWASGRNNKVETTEAPKTSGTDGTAFSARPMKLPCVSRQPLGRPVVPEV